MTDLIAEIQRELGRKSELRLHDAVATGDNTVTVGQSTVAVTLPAIIPVKSGQFCQVLEQGANRVIVGPVGLEVAIVAGGAYTPTPSNVTTLGSTGTEAYSYRWVGGPNAGDHGLLWVYGRVAFSGTGTWSDTDPVTFTIPSDFQWANLTPMTAPIGQMIAYDSGGVVSGWRVVDAASATTIRFVTSTYGAVLSESSPQVTAGDVWMWSACASAVRV